MASISISDLYRGEGPGEKYGGILNAVFQKEHRRRSLRCILFTRTELEQEKSDHTTK